MKNFLLLFLLFISISTLSQENTIVTINVSGSGATIEEARQNALRSAIEQTFGVFISSKTEILNDNLILDEMVSISNGNIHKYEILSELQLPDLSYVSSLSASVSIQKLNSYCASKGYSVEFEGGLFAFNIQLQELNEKNEIVALQNIIEVVYNLTSDIYYGSLTCGEPSKTDDNLYKIPTVVDIKAKEGLNIAMDYFISNIQDIAMSDEEIENYRKLNKPLSELIIVNSEILIDGNCTFKTIKDYHGIYRRVYKPSYNPKKYKVKSIIFRNVSSIELVKHLVDNLIKRTFDFKLNNNNDNVLKLFPEHIFGTLPISPSYDCRWPHHYIKKFMPSEYRHLIDNFFLPYQDIASRYNNSVYGYTFNSKLAGHINDLENRKDNYDKSKPMPIYAIIVHKYLPKATVLKIEGVCIMDFDEVKNTSSIIVDFNKK